MSSFFEFISTASSGLAKEGVVYGAVDSTVNTCVLQVDPNALEEGAISPKDTIMVFLVTEHQRFQVFTGVVSKVKPVGGMAQIEAVTLSAVASVDSPARTSWANTTALAILRDMLGQSRMALDQVSFPPSLSEAFLHVWNTDGESVADEVRQLLQHVDPTILVLGALDGRTLIGTRSDIARSFMPMIYPFDEAVGETDTDVSRFSLRYADVGAACLSAEGEFVGTVSAVRHTIAPGRAYTDILLDVDPDEQIEAWLAASLPDAPLLPVEATDE